jgi:low affinity Fe/Cu permease
MEKSKSKRGADPRERKPSNQRTLGDAFTRFASGAAHWAGRPVAFIGAVLAVLIWAATGPIFGFSDTWQLVINTSTTIITFLMVFLIQNTQNRDGLAVQIKLAELIVAVRGAKSQLATAEDLSEDELERLHSEYQHMAATVLDHLEGRRADGSSERKR